MGGILRGWALTRQREVERGVAQMREGLNGFEATGAEIMKPYFLSLLAEAFGRSDRVDEGLKVLAEALALAEHNAEQGYVIGIANWADADDAPNNEDGPILFSFIFVNRGGGMAPDWRIIRMWGSRPFGETHSEVRSVQNS